MTTPAQAIAATVKLQADRIAELEQQLADEKRQHELWKFRATENGRTTKTYKKLYLEQLNTTHTN